MSVDRYILTVLLTWENYTEPKPVQANNDPTFAASDDIPQNSTVYLFYVLYQAQAKKSTV